MTLEESLRALAEDDEAAVPPHVTAAVMAAWDATGGPLTTGTSTSLSARLSTRWALWVAACVSVVVAAVVVASRPVGDGTGEGTVSSPPLMQQELVLVPELADAGPLMLMRVRMTRREFSRLGIPISNPQGDGLVDVEVLVGEDGVARSIRRAVAVTRARPNQ
jgi:hypothetical protein